MRQPDTLCNRLYANLSRPTPARRPQKAVNAFDESHRRQDGTLSDSAQRRLPARNRRGRPGHVIEIISGDGSVAPIADMSGLSAADSAAVCVDQDPYAAGGQEPYCLADPYAQADEPYGAPGAEDHFFNTSDEEAGGESRKVSPSRIASAAT